MVVLHQDQVYGDCVMGIPETVLEQLSLRRHDQRDVSLNQVWELCPMNARCSFGHSKGLKKAIINHTDPQQLTLLPSGPGTAISQPGWGFPVCYLDSCYQMRSQPRLPQNLGTPRTWDLPHSRTGCWGRNARFLFRFYFFCNK